HCLLIALLACVASSCGTDTAPPVGPSPPIRPPAPQTVTLSGAVRDGASNATLDDVTVVTADSVGTSRTATSASDGTFSIGGLVIGDFVARFSRSGYANVERRGTLTQDTR